jgi:hypothetical protein
MPADIDIGQVLIIVIAMIAAFVQWVWKLVQENKAAKERARNLPPPRTQERSPTPPPALPPHGGPPAQPSRGGVWDLVEEFKKELRKAQGEQIPEPALPPPIPAPPPVKQRPPKPPAAVVVAQVPAVAPTPAPATPLRMASVTSMRDDFVVLRANLLKHDALKQAIILREILGPPKALQSDSGMI